MDITETYTEADAVSARHAMLSELRQACDPLILQALDDKDVIEIIVNPDGKLWIESHSNGMQLAQGNLPVDAAKKILFYTGMLQNTPISADRPIIEGEFPLDGSRIAGLMPPLATAPAFAIRKRSPSVYTLADYKQAGIIKPIGAPALRTAAEAMAGKQRSYEHPLDAIREAVALRKNILIVGGTGSGKTTLTNAILNEIAEQTPRDRLVALEDTMELQVKIANHAILRTSEAVDMQRLLRVTMRLRPDRIVVGEVRGGEAYTLLKSWNSGHPGGVATLHANSSEEGLQKLAHYIYENDAAKSFSQDSIGWMIATTVNMIIVIERAPAAPGRIVSEVCEVTSYMNGRYTINTLRLQTNTGRCEFKLRI